MTTKPYVVVVGTDFSPQGARAVKTAFEQASLQALAELHVVHVAFAVESDSTGSGPPVEALTGLPTRRLDELQKQLVEHLNATLGALPKRDKELQIVAHVAEDVPSVGLTRLARDLDADLIVVGSHGLRGVARWLLGSVTEAVIRTASCKVLVVPPELHELGPSIDPPCPRCVQARNDPSGQGLWCAQHRERHGRRHTYHQGDRVAAETNLPLTVR